MRREDHERALLTAPNRRPLARPPTLEIQRDQFDGSNRRLLHNHPSGDPSPSQADIQMTRAIIDIATPLGIAVHDHIIVGRGGHVSLKGMRLI
jgi:hypothetical protein